MPCYAEFIVVVVVEVCPAEANRASGWLLE